MSSASDARTTPLRVLILQHEDPTPPGLVTEVLAEHGADMEVFRIDLDDDDRDPTGYDLIVSLGSEFAAFDDSKPFVRREADLMARAVDEDVPILGLCFGGQMLARVLGAEVFRSDEAEIGWLPVRSQDPDLVPEGPWFQWHFDVFKNPPGARVIAETAVGPQAFVWGRSLGLQFHPEVTEAIMEHWVRVYRHELDADGLDPDTLMDETRRCIGDSNRMARRMLERYLRDIAGLTDGTVRSDATSVFPRSLDLAYPNVERGEGVWLTTTDGRRLLDACSGGAMVACLGHGVPELAEAAQAQAERIAYYYNHHFTSEVQERFAERVLEVVAPEMARVRFVSGGSEANETALQLARLYHVERGEPERWRVISPAQSYHGATMGTLALNGRRALQEPLGPYLASHLHIAPSTWRFDPTGERALQELDRALEEAGPPTVAAFFCEPISGAALPAYSPPDRFWQGLAERREEHGFLICFDEVVTGTGRVGTWLAADQLPLQPDIVTLGKGLGAGHAPIGAVLCRQHVYDALDRGSREFDLGHTWDGAPLTSAVGLAVLDRLVGDELVERVHARGPSLRDELAAALDGAPIVREVRGRGFLLGIELVDPRDGASFLPVELDVPSIVDRCALDHGLVVTCTHPQADGYAGDQITFAPAFVSSDDELTEMVDRLRATIADVERAVMASLTSGAT